MQPARMPSRLAIRARFRRCEVVYDTEGIDVEAARALETGTTRLIWIIVAAILIGIVIVAVVVAVVSGARV